MSKQKKIIVAIDGFSSCGKSTIAKALAKEVGYTYIDTGAMYRAVALYCMQEGLMDEQWQIKEDELSKRIDKIAVVFKTNSQGVSETYLNGINVEQQIRSLHAATGASKVSQLRMVRQAMVKQQHLMGKDKGIVMDGRDIGTVVFPQAELKIFLTALPEIRAKRRFDELQAKGETISFDEVLKNTIERDKNDMSRAESPLLKADDALLLDNSYLSPEQQTKWIRDAFNKVLESV